MEGGYIGVDVFFVISGYVITQLLLRSPDQGIGRGLVRFYTRRVRRIVPAAALTLVSTLVAARCLLGRQMDPSLPSDTRWASLFAANLRFIRTGTNYFVPGLRPSLITQFWSLGVEEQFYITFPLVFLLIRRLISPARRQGALVAVLSAAVAASAVVSASVPSYYSPLDRFWELGLGCLLAASTARPPAPTARTGRPARTERPAALAGLMLLLVALAVSNAGSDYPGVTAWLPCTGTAVLIWAGGAGERTEITRLLGGRSLAWIGDRSYSLYLWHYVWLYLPGQLAHPLTGWPWRVVELAGTCVTAQASYRWVENPVRRSSRLAADPASVALLLAVAVAAVWLTAAIVAGSVTGPA